ncbi:MAG: hypothetical protein GYB68_16400 [Chloroflexi bacterium]|nr:hypothetical protein [Chloroflexota bacterium]
MTSARRIRVRAYFLPPKPVHVPPPEIPASAALIGISFFLTLVAPFTSSIFPVLLFGSAILMFFVAIWLERHDGPAQRERTYWNALLNLNITPMQAEERASDFEVDAQLADDIADAIRRARLRLDQGPSAALGEPLPLVGPLFWTGGEIPDSDLFVQRGADGHLRFSAAFLLIVFPFAEQVGIYTCSLNLLRGERLRERVMVYHRDELLPAEVIDREVTLALPDSRRLRAARIFRLTDVYGTITDVLIDSPELSYLFGGTIDFKITQAIINQIQTLLHQGGSHDDQDH